MHKVVFWLKCATSYERVVGTGNLSARLCDSNSLSLVMCSFVMIEAIVHEIVMRLGVRLEQHMWGKKEDSVMLVYLYLSAMQHSTGFEEQIGQQSVDNISTTYA